MAASLASIHTRETVRYKWAVFQRRPLSSLSWWKRWLVRRVYKWVGWQTADGEEKQAITDTEAIAKAICAAGGPQWFYHRLPVNVSLPAATCKLDGPRFPLSEASEFYEKKDRHQISVVCPHTGQVCRPHDSIERKDLMRLSDTVEGLFKSA